MDGHRLRPSEACKHQHERANGIQVSERVQSQPPAKPWCVIAELICRPGVRKLVNREGHNQRDDAPYQHGHREAKHRGAHYTIRPGGIIRAIRQGRRSLLPDLKMDDVLRLRKPHPCGCTDWVVVRLGADIGLKCLGCGRRILLSRRELSRRLKAYIDKDGTPASHG